MQFLQKCVAGLSVGSLAQFNSDGLIEERSTGRIIGIISKLTQFEELQPDDSVIIVDVAEITTHGFCSAVLSGSASWQGADLYADGSKLSANGTGSPIAVLIPRTLGEPSADFSDGDTVIVVML